MPYRILVVDDEKDFAGALRRYLESRGFAVTARYGSRDALEAAHKAKPALVLTDAEMPGGMAHDFNNVLAAISDKLHDLPAGLKKSGRKN